MVFKIKVTKTLRLQILKPYNPNEQEHITWEELGKVLNKLRNTSAKALNFVIQKKHLDSAEYQVYKSQTENPLRFKEYLKAKYANTDSIYKQLRKEFPHLTSENASASERYAGKYWNTYIKNILTLEMSIPSFSKNAPILVRADAYDMHYENSTYFISAKLLDTNKKRFNFVLKQGDRSKTAILQRMLSNEYKKGNMQIIRKKEKWFCLIPYTFEVQPQKLDKNKILGVDMGVANAVYWAISDSPKRGYIPGGEIEEFHKRIRARRISMQKQSKHSGKSRSGHGRKRKLLPIDTLSEKEKNFRNTINHRYAKSIVNTALKNNCGIIQLENLSEISTNNRFLKNWPYYDLRTKIEYKAKEHGIKVVIIEPQYTSQRCSECGHITSKNRDRNKTGFECVACGYGTKYKCKDCGHIQTKKNKCEKCESTNTYKLFVHADYNAARNLSILDIDRIIKAELGKDSEPEAI